MSSAQNKLKVKGNFPCICSKKMYYVPTEHQVYSTALRYISKQNSQISCHRVAYILTFFWFEGRHSPQRFTVWAEGGCQELPGSPSCSTGAVYTCLHLSTFVPPWGTFWKFVGTFLIATMIGQCYQIEWIRARNVSHPVVCKSDLHKRGLSFSCTNCKWYSRYSIA